MLRILHDTAVLPGGSRSCGSAQQVMPAARVVLGCCAGAVNHSQGPHQRASLEDRVGYEAVERVRCSCMQAGPVWRHAWAGGGAHRADHWGPRGCVSLWHGDGKWQGKCESVVGQVSKTACGAVHPLPKRFCTFVQAACPEHGVPGPFKKRQATKHHAPLGCRHPGREEVQM